MPLRHLAYLLAGTLAVTTAVAQQALICATPPAGRACDAYHFHVSMFRPDVKQFVELSALNAYATQAACERAREQYAATNTRIIEYLRSQKQKDEADRVGPCHCDTTTLTDAQRTAQLRLQEDLRLRMRERLLDHRLTSDSELVRALWSEPPVTPLLAAPKLVSVPRDGARPVLTAVEDLRAPRIENTKQVAAAMDLPLVDLITPAAPEPPPVETAEAPGPAPAAPEAPVAAEPIVEEVVAAEEHTTPAVHSDAEAIESTVPEDDLISAEETAERFVSYETQRIQNVLRAAAGIADETVKAKIFEACMQRIQLLSNLRLLIEGSGMRSTLAAAAREAHTEADRLALMARLFGDDIKPHWAPHEAADVIFEIEPAIVAEPERALRDTTGSVTPRDKRHALYLVLAQMQPTEDQRLWLSSVVEEFLR